MDSFELNKIAGAILLSFLVLMALGYVSNFIFATDSPEVMGYEIEVAVAVTDGDEIVEEEGVVSVVVRLQDADEEAGVKVAKKCLACHSFESGGANKVGPNLWGIVNRTPAAVPDFAYSSGMVEYASEGVWNFETLDRYLEKPRDVVSGTSMSFAGLKKPKDRADIIEYLRTLADSPVPLPEPTEGVQVSE